MEGSNYWGYDYKTQHFYLRSRLIENLPEFLKFFFINLLRLIFTFSLKLKLFKRAFVDFQSNILFFLYCDPHHM